MVMLNIGCGRDIKKGFINIDSHERENKLDMICDVRDGLPFERESVNYIYAEQFIEHLTWLECKLFLRNCYKVLKTGCTLRLVLPDYRTIFQKYLEGDKDYFKIFFEELNQDDYLYYSKVYHEPEKVKQEREDSPPPAWHLSPRLEDRSRLQLRVRHYDYTIEIVDWFCHQYEEHKCLYDFESLEGILHQIGFSEVKQTNRIDGFDSDAPSRITSSLYVEAKK